MSCEERAGLALTTGNGSERHCQDVVELVLERALPIDGPAGLEPSGLSLLNGRLFTVSDGDDSVIYELSLGEQSALARVALTFTPPRSPEALDLEGISALPEGGFLVASEHYGRVLSVSPQGVADWVTPALASVGQTRGLLRARNAGLEGVTRLPDGSLLLAAERDAPGLIHVPKADQGSPAALTVADCPCLHSARLHADIADLTSYGPEVFALARNEQRVVRLESTKDGWAAVEAFSYAATENDPRFAYRDRTYPLAEGLAVTNERIYLVLDNNETNAHQANPDDRRPMLFVFERPGKAGGASTH